jgi:hypothetical protein
VDGDYDLLERVVLRYLLVTLGQLLEDVLGELVNRLMHLACICLRLIFKHVRTVKLNSESKHPDCLF